MNQQQDLTTGSIPGKLIRFFLPIAAGTLFQQFYNTVDAMVVGKFVGTEALAAVGGSAAMIIALFIGFFVALTSGASAVIAQLAGARREEDVSRAVHSAFAFSILAGLGLMAVGIPVTPRVLQWMKTPPDTMADSIVYLRIYFGGAVFMLVFNMGSSMLQAMGDSRNPLRYLVCSCVCNIILDLVFVVGLRMGIAGVAIATVASQLLSSLLILRKFCTLDGFHRLHLKKLRIHPALMKQMLLVGIPAGLQASMYGVSNMIVQIGVNSLMTVVVAAWSVASKVDGIYSCISTALGVAVMGFVGQNYGAGREDRVRQTLSVAMKIFLPVTVILGVVVLLFSRFCLGIFLEDPEVISATQFIMWHFVPAYLLWTYIELVSGALKGVGDAVWPLIIVGLGVCVFRLFWMGLVFPFARSISGLSLCYPVSWFITAVALSIHCRKKGWGRRKAAA